MKVVWIGLLAVLAACSRGSEGPARPPAAARSVAVVELFTSEGCSSCPPADANLIEIARDDRPIYALSFHVDYWDDLGWRDPFSSSRYSERQRRYAGFVGAGRIYTPQMIINGREQVLGSDRTAARAAIDRALSQAAALTIRLGLSREGESVRVSWELSSVPEGAILNLALVQAADGVRVTRGENAGRELSHANVVRAFESVVLAGERGARTLRWLSGTTLIAYVARRDDPAVLGATSARL